MTELDHGGATLGGIHRRANEKKFFCYFTGYLEGIVASGHVEAGEVMPLVALCEEFVENVADADASDLFQDFHSELLELETIEVVIEVRSEAIDSDCPKSSVNRFLGYCAGIACDGVLTIAEVEGILRRAAQLGESVARPGIREVFNTARDALIDGFISDQESGEIAKAICRLVGENYYDTGLTQISSSAVIDEHIIASFPDDIEGMVFVMTEGFDSNPRSLFEERLQIAGMSLAKSVTSKTDYLVVGGRPSRDWLETNRGTKLIKAMELRDKTDRPRLVSEAQLHALLSREGL
ncbi:hypothetical protein [uncultured Paracoccus sp.]|uniref:hypothetical protein n=1 Tax=uncultured Paracoccus sp. TaxID=189685 RepID=UPI00262B4896|nr:hypothetical protein [uncultured Paracoccus sp.]